MESKLVIRENFVVFSLRFVLLLLKTGRSLEQSWWIGVAFSYTFLKPSLGGT
jgi:hypothetical protein